MLRLHGVDADENFNSIAEAGEDVRVVVFGVFVTLDFNAVDPLEV